MDTLKFVLFLAVIVLVLAPIVSIAGPLLGTLIGGAIGFGLALLLVKHGPADAEAH